MGSINDAWVELAEAHGDEIRGFVSQYKWKRLAKKLSLSYEEARAFGIWFREWSADTEDSSEPGAADPSSSEEESDHGAGRFEHDKPYWYDPDRDTYVVSVPSRPRRPLALPGDTWRAIREAYSNWDQSPSSLNEVARQFGLARRTIVELLRVMETTHDSSPWTDEDLAATKADELVEDLLRRKEERVLSRAEKIEWQRIKKDAEKFRRIELLSRHLFEKFKNIGATYDPPKLKLHRAREPYAVIISPTDYHHGKMGVGSDPYDRDLAKKRLWKVTESLISRIAERGRPEVVFLALGGDGLHIDNATSTTTRGTAQSCDGSPEELASTWVELCRDYVDLVRQIAPVKLFVIPGNHDRYTATLLRAAMCGWFHQAEDVEVVDTTSPRQYVTYGDSIIAFLHGDIGKVKDWPAIASAECREWSSLKWKYIMTGHLHTERELPTYGGVTVYRMPSLAGTDSWHHRSGYVGGRKSLIAYLVDKKRGITAQEIEPAMD